MYFVESRDRYNTGYYLKDTFDGVTEFYSNLEVDEMHDKCLDIKGFYRCGVHPVVPVDANSYCYIGEYWGEGHIDGYLHSPTDFSNSLALKPHQVRLFIPEDPNQDAIKIKRYTGYVHDICGENSFLLALDDFEHMEEVKAKFIGSFTPYLPLRCFFHARNVQRLLRSHEDAYGSVSYEKPESCRRAVYMSGNEFISAVVSSKASIKQKVVFLEDKQLYIDSYLFTTLLYSICEQVDGMYSWDIFDYHDFSLDSLRSESPELYEFCKLVESIYVPAPMCYGNDKEYCNIQATSKGALIQSLEVLEGHKKVVCRKEKLIDFHRNGEWGRFVVSNPTIAVIHLLGETRAVYEEPLLEDNDYAVDTRVTAKRKLAGSGDCELTESGDLLKCTLSPSGIFDIPEGTKRICSGSITLGDGELSKVKGFVFPKSLEEIDDVPIKAHGLYGTFTIDCSKHFICWKSTKRGLFKKLVNRLELHKHDLSVSFYKTHSPRPDFLKLNLCNRVEVIGGLLGTELGEMLTGVQGHWYYGDKVVFDGFISQLTKVDKAVLLRDLEICFKLYVKTPKLDAGRFNIPKPIVRATVGKEVTNKYGYSVHPLPEYSDYVSLRHSMVAEEHMVFEHFKSIYYELRDYLSDVDTQHLDALVSEKWTAFSQYRLNYLNWLTSIGVYDEYTGNFDRQKFIRLYRSGKFA